MKKKIFYKWVVLQNNEIIRCGIENKSIEIFVEHIFPCVDSFADRNLSEMQKYANKYLSNHKYLFKYKQIEIDFSDLE